MDLEEALTTLKDMREECARADEIFECWDERVQEVPGLVYEDGEFFQNMKSAQLSHEDFYFRLEDLAQWAREPFPDERKYGNCVSNLRKRGELVRYGEFVLMGGCIGAIGALLDGGGTPGIILGGLALAGESFRYHQAKKVQEILSGDDYWRYLGDRRKYQKREESFDGEGLQKLQLSLENYRFTLEELSEECLEEGEGVEYVHDLEAGISALDGFAKVLPAVVKAIQNSKLENYFPVPEESSGVIASVRVRAEDILRRGKKYLQRSTVGKS